ncbi:hypothetical protein T08_4814 [Trichinella sp. T8]|nr:hypothetical protein T08_4814 [Trichinella sp. T8]
MERYVHVERKKFFFTQLCTKQLSQTRWSNVECILSVRYVNQHRLKCNFPIVKTKTAWFIEVFVANCKLPTVSNISRDIEFSFLSGFSLKAYCLLN